MLDASRLRLLRQGDCTVEIVAYRLLAINVLARIDRAAQQLRPHLRRARVEEHRVVFVGQRRIEGGQQIWTIVWLPSDASGAQSTFDRLLVPGSTKGGFASVVSTKDGSLLGWLKMPYGVHVMELADKRALNRYVSTFRSRIFSMSLFGYALHLLFIHARLCTLCSLWCASAESLFSIPLHIEPCSAPVAPSSTQSALPISAPPADNSALPANTVSLMRALSRELHNENPSAGTCEF